MDERESRLWADLRVSRRAVWELVESMRYLQSTGERAIDFGLYRGQHATKAERANHGGI
jgi:hypothetical protein